MGRVRAPIAEHGNLNGATFVLDLFTCTSYRFIQADGGLALPIKIGTKFHLLGDLEICEDNMLKTAISKALPLISALPGKKINLPPLPRFIAGGCCGERTHAGNVNAEGHGDKFLKKIMHLRAVLRAEISGSSLEGHWIADPISSLLDSDLLRPVSASDLGHYFCGDNVHFSPLGYNKLVAGISSCFAKAEKNVPSAAVSSCVSGTQRSKDRFYWRGFVSDVGATRTGFKPSVYASTRKPLANKRNHPYRGRKR